MNNQVLSFVLSLFLFLVSYSYSYAQTDVSPIQFGIKEASTDIERYWVLYKTHKEAELSNTRVTYIGLDTIRIEIPLNANPIPLSHETDFSGVVIVVKNNSKDMVLFSMNHTLDLCDINYKRIEKRKRIQGKGNYLIVLEDDTPWVDKRLGFNYGHIRKDIVYVKDGKVDGTVVSSYGTIDTKPKYLRTKVNDCIKKFSSITFIRDSISTYKTNLLSIVNQYNVIIDNVSIKTPQNNLYGDAAIRLENCYKVMICNSIIDGTYSQENKYGYGISMNNVSDVEIVNLKGDAKWGIFGNNNINNVLMRDCDINRFDVHCYGKDIRFENCKFRKLYNQFSSMFGTVSFENCEFVDFTPVLFESSYNAYTKFNLVFKDCVFYLSKNRCSLIYGGDLNGEKTTGRKELGQQEYPDLYIDGLKVIMPSDVSSFYIYNFKKRLIRWPMDEVPSYKQLSRIEIIPEQGNKTNMAAIIKSKCIPLICIGSVAVLCVVYRYGKKKCSV